MTAVPKKRDKGIVHRKEIAAMSSQITKLME